MLIEFGMTEEEWNNFKERNSDFTNWSELPEIQFEDFIGSIEFLELDWKKISDVLLIVAYQKFLFHIIKVDGEKIKLGEMLAIASLHIAEETYSANILWDQWNERVGHSPSGIRSES